MKSIICNTPRGQYSIPLKVVAEHRADYYACEVDGYEKDSPEWKSEVDFVIHDNFESIDWLLNNTRWEDWEGIATKINDKVKVTDDDFWTCSDDFMIE
jgi:hypothetical protein